MKCPACQRDNRPEAEFCAWCGKRLVAEPPPDVAGSSPSPPEAQTDTQPSEPATESKAPAPAAEMSATENLPAETLLRQRYRIVEALGTQDGARLYRAEELGRCVACGTHNDPEKEYCQQCGAALETSSYVTILERPHIAPEEYADHFRQGSRDYYVKHEDGAVAAAGSASTKGALFLEYGYASDTGRQRDKNEDTVLVQVHQGSQAGPLGLFLVADGVGGQQDGERASALAAETVWRIILDDVWLPIVRDEAPTTEGIDQALESALQQANQAVYEERLTRSSDMSTTLTVALLIGEAAYVGNVGDSRTYLWNEQGLVSLTEDHSVVERLVREGKISPQERYTHPQRNLIYNSVGDQPDISPDCQRRDLSAGDSLLLCSDGLWETVREEGLEEVLLSEPDPQRACDRLVEHANTAGGEDNISVILVRLRGY